MEVVRLIFFAFVALFILVTFHEFGHYWVARRCGVKVLRFSIGFGPILLKKQIGETEFAFSAIPLGGYVKMFGENTHEQSQEQDQEELISKEDEEVSYSHKSVWQRMAIVLAGPIANFILAILVYFMVFMGGTRGIVPIIGELETGSIAELAGLEEGAEIKAIDGETTPTWADVFGQLVTRIGDTGEIQIDWGFPDTSSVYTSQLQIQRWQSNAEEPDLLGSLGIEPFIPVADAVLAEVQEDSAAERAGFQAGDRILETNGKTTPLWQDWTEIVRSSPEQELEVLLERGSNNERVMLTLVPEAKLDNGEEIGLAGVLVESPPWDESMKRDRSYNLGSAFMAATERTWDMSVFILETIKKLFTGQVSTKSLGGPISIAKFAGDSAEAGWQTFFQFIAMMSVMLAVMNLLPIPVLDGGHFLFYVVEAVKGSPLSEALQGIAMRVGMTAIFGIMLLALYNDFARL